MTDAGLNRSADIEIVRRLYRDGLLSDDAFVAARAVLRPASSWFFWARRMLLFFGSTMLLVGIIFFFAYNWSAMGRFFKFGLIEAGIIVCIVASHLRGRTRLSGKVLVLSASVLVGVLLAVYGQTYQTGADAFGLFVAWAVLIFGWVVVTDFAGLWLLWLVLANTGAILYWFQVGAPANEVRYEFLCFALAMLNGTALALREFGLRRGLEWLGGRWLRGLLFTAPLVALSIPTLHLIVESESAGGVGVLAAFAWVVIALGGYLCYRLRLPDMIPLALIVMNACVLLLTFIGNVLFNDTSSEGTVLFLFFALIIVGVVSGAAVWLRITASSMASAMKKSSV